MSFDPEDVAGLAEAYTAAWNSGSPQNVAAHFAVDGEIVINRGTPILPMPNAQSTWAPAAW